MALSTVPTHATGDVFPATDWNTYVRDNLNSLVVAGANLASAGTLTPTNEFHIVTGSTTVDNLSPATPAVGQEVILLFQAALTVRNNGGGTGNIRTRNGVDRSVQANETITFAYDGAVWRETGFVGQKVTISTLAGGPPASPADTDIWIATNVDGVGGRWYFIYDSAESTYKWKCLGGAPLYAAGSFSTTSGNASGYYDMAGGALTLPRGGDYMIRWGMYGTGVGGGGVVGQLVVAGSAVQSPPTLGNNAPMHGGPYKAASAAASAIAKLQGNHVNGQTYSYSGWIEATPTKVI